MPLVHLYAPIQALHVTIVLSTSMEAIVDSTIVDYPLLATVGYTSSPTVTLGSENLISIYISQCTDIDSKLNSPSLEELVVVIALLELAIQHVVAVARQHV